MAQLPHYRSCPNCEVKMLKHPLSIVRLLCENVLWWEENEHNFVPQEAHSSSSPQSWGSRSSASLGLDFLTALLFPYDLLSVKSTPRIEFFTASFKLYFKTKGRLTVYHSLVPATLTGENSSCVMGTESHMNRPMKTQVQQRSCLKEKFLPPFLPSSCPEELGRSANMRKD